MKRHIAFMAFFVSFACLAAPTANEDFVLAEDAQTYTNAVRDANQYTDEKVAAVSVAGNYSAVSNAAMSAAAATNDFLRTTGGRIRTNEYDMFLGYGGPYAPRSGLWWLDLVSPCGIGCDSLLGNLMIINAGYTLWLPEADGTLALRTDVGPLVSNTVTRAYVEGLGISSDESDPVWESEKSNYATKSEVQGAAASAATAAVAPVVAIVDTWEGYWGGSNVVFEVTNYYGNTTGAKPRLRIREYRDEQWRTVWDEENKFSAAESNIVNRVAETNAALRVALKADFAPIAWGTVTDKGSPNPVTNTTFMTSPETYFAGGTEYQRVAVGSGTICVLVDRGALARTVGQPGTFRFQDDGGTNFFGFAKSDSYTIGCRTDGITVDGGLVTLRYDVIMADTDVPVVYWRENLHEGSWTQLNNVDGTVADGAPYAVTWYTSGGSYYAAINCTGNASGFFRAETSVMGDVVWETNMRARLGGGLECTNTATHVNGVIRPSYNGSTVIWTWSVK